MCSNVVYMYIVYTVVISGKYCRNTLLLRACVSHVGCWLSLCTIFIDLGQVMISLACFW